MAKIGKKRGQYPAVAGSAGFAMRSIERRRALQEGYPTADRELPRSPGDMGRAIGFSGDDADFAPVVTTPARLPGRLAEELKKAIREAGSGPLSDDAAQIKAKIEAGKVARAE